jgi:hypothetical protein
MARFRTTWPAQAQPPVSKFPGGHRGTRRAGKRPPVAVTLGGHTFPSTVAVMGGRHLIAVNAEVRKRTGLQAGDTTEVRLTLDATPEPPQSLTTWLRPRPLSQERKSPSTSSHPASSGASSPRWNRPRRPPPGPGGSTGPSPG